MLAMRLKCKSKHSLIMFKIRNIRLADSRDLRVLQSLQRKVSLPQNSQGSAGECEVIINHSKIKKEPNKKQKRKASIAFRFIFAVIVQVRY